MIHEFKGQNKFQKSNRLVKVHMIYCITVYAIYCSYKINLFPLFVSNQNKYEIDFPKLLFEKLEQNIT